MPCMCLQYKRDLFGRSTLLEFCVVFLLLSTSALSYSPDGTKTAETRCGIYLAPSTIPQSGLGVFAGDKHYMEDDIVAGGDIVIPIVDIEWNNKGGPFESSFFLLNEYSWTSPTFPGMEDEVHDPHLISGVSPGVGALPNCYASMMNIEDSWSLMGRSVDADSPGIGASTLYYGREFYATTNISPGRELFLDYGDNYFRHRTGTYGYIPDPNSFISTDIFLRKYLRIKRMALKRRKHSVVADSTLLSGSATALTNESSTHDIWKDLYNIVIKGMRSVWLTSRILNGIPDDSEQIEHIMLTGGSSQQHYNRSVREIPWLEENGQCMDNIKGGDSTIPDAGRGAFANRFIPKGGLVGPAPLIHVQDYNALKTFLPKFNHTDLSNKTFSADRDGPFTFQLILNYCFGHDKSTLLLCPYGLFTSVINHSHQNPNTRIQWSQRMRHPEWREQPIYQWSDVGHTGLQFDFVALRDIEEGEEILIDYGVTWEAAWHEHVQRFVPREDYIPAFELNEMPDLEFRTDDEDDYEARGVFLMCHGWYLRQKYVEHDKDAHCRILKNLENDRYVVQVLEIDLAGSKDGRMTIEEGTILWSVPSDALFFKDMPNSRDHYQPNVFRHAMMIPDDMFPEIWKNKP